MKERPILFSGAMVRAILDGRKTQTRRILKGSTEFNGPYNPAYLEAHRGAPGWKAICPYGVPGDRLWVRETWTSGYQDGAWGTICRADSAFVYGKRQHEKGPHFHAKEIGDHIRWRPSIFLPRWASRITLEITDVRVQRLQEISEADAQAEGVEPIPHSEGPNFFSHCNPFGWHNSPTAKGCFSDLWDSINGKTHPWASNPWVWVLTFRRLA